MTMYLSAATFLALAVCSEAFVIPVGTTLTYPRSTISFVAEPLALSDDVAADGDVLEEPVAEVPAAEEEQEDEEPKKVIARERHTMFVGNLPFDTTDADVRDFFAQHGKVELVSVPRNKETGLPRGFAFVDMSTEEELEAAVANLDGVMFNERLLRVTKSVPKEEIKKTPRNKSPEPVDGQKIYVGNLPFEATREQLMELYSQYGEVKSVFIPSDRTTGAGRGFAFVTMSDEDAANAIESTNGMEFEGRRLVVSEPLPPGEKGGPRRKPQVKLYIGNLSFYTVADTLVEIFEEFGKVHDVYLPPDDSTGGSRGFGFITMDKDAADQAIAELDGCEIDGRIVRVNASQPKRSTRQSDDEGEDY